MSDSPLCFTDPASPGYRPVSVRTLTDPHHRLAPPSAGLASSPGWVTTPSPEPSLIDGGRLVKLAGAGKAPPLPPGSGCHLAPRDHGVVGNGAGLGVRGAAVLPVLLAVQPAPAALP